MRLLYLVPAVSYPEMIKMASGKPIRLKATEEEDLNLLLINFLVLLQKRQKQYNK